MPFQARAWSQQQFAVFPHTSVSLESWQHQFNAVSTGAGTSTGTTVVASGVNDANDTWNGYHIEITSGACKGQIKLIVDFVQSSGTFTVENDGQGFTAQIASGVSFRVWKSPIPLVVIDSSSGATDAVDATRSEADDFWNGYWLVPARGAGMSGKKAQITDFTSSSGTFVTGTGFTAAHTVGDVCYILKFVEVSDFSASLAQEYIPRLGGRLNNAMADGTVGPKSGSVSFNTHVTPFGSLPSNGVAPTKSVLADLLIAGGMVESRPVADLAASGSTTSNIRIGAASWEAIPIGSAVLWNGNLSFVASLIDNGATDDGFTVSPAFPDTPAASDTLTFLSRYSKTVDSDLYGCGIIMEHDGIRTILTGCKGNVTLTHGPALVLNFEYTVANWYRDRCPAAYSAASAYTTTAPVLGNSQIAYLDTVKTNISGFTATPGTKVVLRDVQGARGMDGNGGVQVTGYAAGCTWQELLNSSGELSQEVRYLARTASDLKVVYGDGNASFCAVRIPVATHIEAAHPTDADGLASVPCVYGAMDAGLYVDPANAQQKIPDFAIFLS